MFKRVNIATFVTFLVSLFAIGTVVLTGCPSAEADDDDSSVADDDDSSVTDDDDVVDDDDSAADDDDSGE